MLAKRLTLSLLAIGVISLVVTAASFALFTDTTSNSTNTFTAGTVDLDVPTVVPIDVTNIAPGDSGTAQYSVKYIGSLQAFLGLTTVLSGDLTTCDGGKFHMTIKDAALNNYLTTGSNQVVGLFNTNDVATFNIAWNLDLAAGNDCQGDAASLSMMVKAVQAKNNTTGSGPTSW